MQLSKPELIALLLYVQGKTGRIGEEIRGKTRLMKIIFLLIKEAGLDKIVSEGAGFKAFKYGPFDAEVYDAIEALKELGIVEEKSPKKGELQETETPDEDYDDETVYKLSLSGVAKVQRIAKELSPEVVRKLSNYKTIYGDKPLVEILHYVYNKYPEFAKLSEAKI